jgi:hypothetical protein
VDSAATEAKAKEFLRTRFEVSYHFIRQRSLFFNENGRLLLNISRRAARWPCWRSGFPGLIAQALRKPGVNH